MQYRGLVRLQYKRFSSGLVAENRGLVPSSAGWSFRFRGVGRFGISFGFSFGFSFWFSSSRT